MKYLIKKLIKNLTKSNALSDGFERSSTPLPLPPFADASNYSVVVVFVVVFVDPFFFFCHAVVFGVLFVPRFVGTQNASRHSVVVAAMVSARELMLKKEDGRW